MQIAAANLAVLVNAAFVLLLWNWLMPDLLGFSKITLPDVIGLLFLIAFLRPSSSPYAGN